MGRYLSHKPCWEYGTRPGGSRCPTHRGDSKTQQVITSPKSTVWRQDPQGVQTWDNTSHLAGGMWDTPVALSSGEHGKRMGVSPQFAKQEWMQLTPLGGLLKLTSNCYRWPWCQLRQMTAVHTCCVPGTGLPRLSPPSASSSPPHHRQVRCHPHQTEEETECHGDEVTCPADWSVVGLGSQAG